MFIVTNFSLSVGLDIFPAIPTVTELLNLLPSVLMKSIPVWSVFFVNLSFVGLRFLVLDVRAAMSSLRMQRKQWKSLVFL